MSVITEQGLEPRRRAPGDPRRTTPRAPTARVSGQGPQFFMPGEEGGRAQTERSYAALREAVAEETELTPRARRIFSISCRLRGSDCTIEVGKPVPTGEGSVLAILDVGGDKPYCVHVTGGGPALRLGKRVYSTIEFR